MLAPRSRIPITVSRQSEVFLNLKTAYDILSDSDQRRNYDAFHSSREFVRDRRPLSAKEAAWLVDQQKRSWGVREIHPFAVCILCESCPCPADGVCYACGMTFCQMCVRKMHTNGKTVPHYPCRNSTKFSEDLKVQGKEKEAERRMLKGPSNKWLMSDAEFNHQRDVYRCGGGRPEHGRGGGGVYVGAGKGGCKLGGRGEGEMAGVAQRLRGAGCGDGS